jgi:prophage regulatory protein
VTKRICRLPETESKTGLKHSQIYERMSQGTFPRQVRLGPKCVGWIEAEIDAWIDEHIARRDSEPKPKPKVPIAERIATARARREAAALARTFDGDAA